MKKSSAALISALAIVANALITPPAAANLFPASEDPSASDYNSDFLLVPFTYIYSNNLMSGESNEAMITISAICFSGEVVAKIRDEISGEISSRGSYGIEMQLEELKREFDSFGKPDLIRANIGTLEKMMDLIKHSKACDMK